ncbi:MAG: lysophospholipid acyltransferase family protein [Planctomycetota bacterium]|nr:lysophospholipid acyltransferase family protein [Planctomycetota bacterium]
MEGSLVILPVIILAAFAFCLLFILIRGFQCSPYNTRQTMIAWINVCLTRILWRVEVNGQLPEKSERGGVIVCNHRGSVDPCFIQLGAYRIVHWFVAREFFSIPVVGALLRITGSIPANRAGIDTASTKAAIRMARAGEWIGMLPEGRINQTEALLLPGRPGAALVALKAQVPVVPCYLEGIEYDGTFWGCLFTPGRVKLTIGEPIELDAYFGREREAAVLGELTLLFLKRIAELAGRPDFEPQLAGRRWSPITEREDAQVACESIP